MCERGRERNERLSGREGEESMRGNWEVRKGGGKRGERKGED